MKQSFTVNFYVRNAKRTKNGTAPLEICINCNGSRKFVNTQYRTTPEEFKKKRLPKALTDYMSLMRTRVNEILTDMLRNGEPVTTQALVDYLKCGGYRSYSVRNLFEEYIGLLRERVGKNLTPGVLRKYELVRDLFYEFVDPEKECSRELTQANVLRFKAKVEGKYEQATAAGYLRKLKTMLTYAFENGKIKANPFQGIKIRKGLKPIVYLKEWEQKALLSTPIENASLARVRDCAVLQMATGMAYADLKNFRKSDVKEKNGIFYIEKPRQKTGKVFTAVVLKEGLEVLEKYEDMKVISVEKYDSYLKVIQDLCQIKTKLTSHVFRRTYACNLLNSGVRIESVAAAMGHSVKICTRYYAKLEEESVLGEIAAKIG